MDAFHEPETFILSLIQYGFLQLGLVDLILYLIYILCVLIYSSLRHAFSVPLRCIRINIFVDILNNLTRFVSVPQIHLIKFVLHFSYLIWLHFILEVRIFINYLLEVIGNVEWLIVWGAWRILFLNWSTFFLINSIDNLFGIFGIKN